VTTITVVGLGPAGPDLLTAGTLAAIDRVAVRFLRTGRHPSAPAVPGATTFDHLYDASGSFEEVYGRIVEDLLAAAHRHGEVLYAVPGSPRVAERSVELLLAHPEVTGSGVAVEVVPALSFADLTWARLGVDPLAAGVRIVDGRRFAVDAAGQRGPLLVAQCDTRHVLSDIKLAVPDGEAPAEVVVLQRLGLPDESVTTVAWDDLDRTVEPDHLTSLWIAELAAPVAAEVVRFAELVHTLRERCPWDREQTHASLTRFLIEETYEVIEAIEGLEAHGHGPLEEELGDLMFQLVFHSTLAAEVGEFTLADVARGIHDKLVRRHPHVFAEVEAGTPDAVIRNWEQIKKAEKGRSSLMEGIPTALPSLLYALKVGRKAATVGFDWPDVASVRAKVDEELAELDEDPSSDELGDVLFALVQLARHLDLDPESAVRGAVAKFRERFETVERLAGERSIDLVAADAALLDALWEEAKRGRP
jgi:tetrapyrrole methylase family protein / MazG family protein